MKTPRIIGIVVLGLAMFGCLPRTYLTRKTTIERDAAGSITKTIDEESIMQEVDAEKIRPELLKGVKIWEPQPNPTD